MENHFPLYAPYAFVPDTFIPSINVPYEVFEQMKMKMNEQHQEISQLRSQNQSLKNLLIQFESEQIKPKKPSQEPLTVKRQKSQRTFICDYENCDRIYASTLALNLHIKTKHNGGTKKQRDAYAKLIVIAEINGQPRPQINFYFPRNYIQNFKQRFLAEQSLQKKQKFQVQYKRQHVTDAL